MLFLMTLNFRELIRLVMAWYTDRQWMYERTDGDGYFKPEYCYYVDLFLDFAFSNDVVVDTRVNMHGETIREIKCPCYKCQNIVYRDRDTVQNHLYTDGFIKFRLDVSFVNIKGQRDMITKVHSDTLIQ